MLRHETSWRLQLLTQPPIYSLETALRAGIISSQKGGWLRVWLHFTPRRVTLEDLVVGDGCNMPFESDHLRVRPIQVCLLVSDVGKQMGARILLPAGHQPLDVDDTLSSTTNPSSRRIYSHARNHFSLYSLPRQSFV
jgi:hypothetical protein